MEDYTISSINETEFNMLLNDNFVIELEDIANKLSLNITEEMSIISNIELINTMLYRKAVSTFINYLKEYTEYKANICYTLNISYKDEKYILLIRNNALDNDEQEGLYKGINGVIYGTSI